MMIQVIAVTLLLSGAYAASKTISVPLENTGAGFVTDVAFGTPGQKFKAIFDTCKLIV